MRNMFSPLHKILRIVVVQQLKGKTENERTVGG